MSASHHRQQKAPQRAENRKAEKQKRWKRGGYSWQLLAWALMITDAFRANQAIAEDAAEDKADPDLNPATTNVDQVDFKAPNIAPEAPEPAPEAPQAPLAQPIIEEAAQHGGEPVLHGPMVAAAEWTPEASHFSGWRPAEYERVEIHLPTGRIPLNPDLDFFEGLQDFISQLGFEGGLEEMLEALNPAIAGIVELGVFFSEEALAPVAVWEVVDDTPEQISFWVGDQFDVDWIVQGAGLTDDGAPVVEQINGVGGAVVDQQISEDGKFIKNSAVLVDGQDWDGTLWVTGDYYEFNTIVQINLLWDNDTLTLVRLDDSGATSTEIIGGRNSQTNSAQIVDFNGRLALDEDGLQGEDRHHDNYVWSEEDEDALDGEVADDARATDASGQAADEQVSDGQQTDASETDDQAADDAAASGATEADDAEQESDEAEDASAEDAAGDEADSEETEAEANAPQDTAADDSADEENAADDSAEETTGEETTGEEAASDAGDDADAEETGSETGPAAGVVENAASDAMALIDEDDNDSAQDGSDEPGAADQALADVAGSDDDDAEDDEADDDEADAETPVAAAPETPAPVEEEVDAESVDGETGEDVAADIAGDDVDSDPAETVEIAAADQGDATGDAEDAPGDADQGTDQAEPAAEAAGAAEDAADDVAESASALMDEDDDAPQAAPPPYETAEDEIAGQEIAGQETAGQETAGEETGDEETGDETPVEQQAAAEEQPEEPTEEASSGEAQPEEELAASEHATDETVQASARQPAEAVAEEADDDAPQDDAQQDDAQSEADPSEPTDEPGTDEPHQQVAAAAGEAAETPSDPPVDEASADNGSAVEDDTAEQDDAQDAAPGGGEAADQTTVAAIAENNDSDAPAGTGESAEQEPAPQAAAANADAQTDDPEPDAAADDAKPVDRAQLRADMLASIDKGDADYTVDPDDPGSVNTGALIDAVTDGKSQSVLDMAANAQFEDVHGEPDQLILGDYSEHFSAIQFNDLVDLDDITMVVADTYSALMNLADPVDFASIVNGDHHQKNQSLMVGGVNTGGHGMSQQEFYELKQSSGPIKTVNGNFYEFNTIFQINIAFDIDEFFGVDDEDEVIGSGGMIQFNEAGIFENDARDDLFVGGNYTEYNMVLQVNAMEDSDTITQIRAVDWAKQADIAIDPITKHGHDGADGHGPQDTIKSAGVFDDTSAYSLSMDGQV